MAVKFESGMKGYLNGEDLDCSIVVNMDADVKLFNNNWKVSVTKEEHLLTNNQNVNIGNIVRMGNNTN